MRKIWKTVCLCVSAAILLTGCTARSVGRIPENGNSVSETAETQELTSAEKAEKLLSSMSTEEKIYQMFMVRPEDLTGIGIAVQAGEATKSAVQKYPVGGIIYFSQNVEDRQQLKTMIENTQSYSKIPMWIAVDEEGGRVARLGNTDIGVTPHPPMREVGERGNPEEAKEIGASIAKDLKELGFNLDFAPVADLLMIENNEDIGNRSFGRDPELVSKMVSAEVTGMQNGGVSATLKHFPGNGSTVANTHLGYGESTRTLEEMRENEFVPFKAGIDAGVDMVMVAHMSAVEITGDETPSTLSKKIVTELLRDELGFEKVIVSDALNMGAITEKYSPGEAAAAAVDAGIDLLLMSPDFPAAVEELKQKIADGTLSEERIDESVRRILTLKYEREIIS